MSDRGYIGQVESRLLQNMVMTPSGCWEWTKYRDDNGYGQTYYMGKVRNVHRVAYLVFVGEIPTGLRVLHSCDNPPCFNPEHLFAGTQKDNVQDMIKKGRGLVGTKNGASKLTPELVSFGTLPKR